MAAKTLDQAIELAMTIGPANEFKTNLKKQLRDFFSHEVMRYQAEMLGKPGVSGVAKSDGAIELFERVFQGVSAFRGSK